MRIPRSLFCVLFLFATSSYIWAGDAHAYLDPGTGSYVFQLVIATLLGAAFAVKVFWFRIKTFFTTLTSKKSKGK
jgi:hypothetical protein